MRAGRLPACHDIAEGGLLVAVAEAALAGGLGASLDLTNADETELFGEAVGGFLVSGPTDALVDLTNVTTVSIIGEVSETAITLHLAGGEKVELLLDELRNAHGALAALFD